MRKTTLLVSLLMIILMAAGAASAKTVMLEWYNDAAWHEPGHDALSVLAEKEIGIGVKTISFPDTSTYQTQMRMALTTPSAPPLFDWWFGYRMKDLVDAGLVADVTHVWQKHIETGEYPASLMSSFGFDGKAYAIPKMVNYWVMLYNRNVFEELNLTVPETWDDFILLCDKLKQEGVTPIGAVGLGWEPFVWFQEILIRIDPEMYVDLMEGRIKYNDPKVVDAVKLWKDMMDRGYFSEAGMTGEARDKAFMQGKIAMILLGDWFAPMLIKEGMSEAEFGLFVVPGVTDKGSRALIVEGRPILVAARSRQRAEAEKFLDYFMTVEAQTEFANVLSISSTNGLVPQETRPSYLRQLSQDVADGKYDLYTRYWEATPPEIVEPVVELLGKFMAHPDQYMQVLNDAANIADKYWERAK
jgi:multiple sugar transport system substrate-binding protein